MAKWVGGNFPEHSAETQEQRLYKSGDRCRGARGPQELSSRSQSVPGWLVGHTSGLKALALKSPGPDWAQLCFLVVLVISH